MSSPSTERVLRDEQTRIKAVYNALSPLKEATRRNPETLLESIAERPIDILTVSEADREHLLRGRKISITTDGNTAIRKAVPGRALMVSFTKVHDLLHVKPQITQYRVCGNVDRNSIQALLDMFTTKHCLQMTQIKLATEDFAQNVLLYHACLSLGLVQQHTKPLLDRLRADITARMLDIEEMDSIVKRISNDDPLFKHLAHDLCHRRFRKEIADIVAFEKWLSSKRTLQRVMVEIDQIHVKRREAINSWKGKARVAVEADGKSIKEGHKV